MQSETDDSMQTDTDNISLEICQMMQAKDEQIRRLVLGMERCVRTRSHRTPHVNTLSCFCVLPHSMQLQQTSQKLEHAKAMNDGVKKHSRLKREVTKHRAALADAESFIDDL